MKKLMIAALAVAGMSAFADEAVTNKYVAAEKIQLTFKQVNTQKVDSVKYNGFVFWTDKESADPTVVIWNKDSKSMFVTNGQDTVKGKNVKFKKLYKPVDLGAYESEIFTGLKKSGKAVSFGDDYVGYGAGTVAAKADLIKGSLTIKESVSGNMVNQKDREYGTWKMSFDKSTTKLLQNGYTLKDVLLKNKVEFWDL